MTIIREIKEGKETLRKIGEDKIPYYGG